jgi:hypothetical protein
MLVILSYPPLVSSPTIRPLPAWIIPLSEKLFSYMLDESDAR